jgi:hypothetical protein
MIEIRAASLPADLPVVRRLLIDYASGLGVDPGFLHLDEHPASLPGMFLPPAG